MTNREFGFRKYHRKIAMMVSFPLILIALTGLLSPVLEVLNFLGTAEWVRQIHSGKILLGSAYFIYTGLTGLGLLWLLFTGLNMLRLFGKGASSKNHKQGQLKVSHQRK